MITRGGKKGDEGVGDKDIKKPSDKEGVPAPTPDQETRRKLSEEAFPGPPKPSEKGQKASASTNQPKEPPRVNINPPQTQGASKMTTPARPEDQKHVNTRPAGPEAKPRVSPMTTPPRPEDRPHVVYATKGGGFEGPDKPGEKPNEGQKGPKPPKPGSNVTDEIDKGRQAGIGQPGTKGGKKPEPTHIDLGGDIYGNKTKQQTQKSVPPPEKRPAGEARPQRDLSRDQPPSGPAKEYKPPASQEAKVAANVQRMRDEAQRRSPSQTQQQGPQQGQQPPQQKPSR